MYSLSQRLNEISRAILQLREFERKHKTRSFERLKKSTNMNCIKLSHPAKLYAPFVNVTFFIPAIQTSSKLSKSRRELQGTTCILSYPTADIIFISLSHGRSLLRNSIFLCAGSPFTTPSARRFPLVQSQTPLAEWGSGHSPQATQAISTHPRNMNFRNVRL